MASSTDEQKQGAGGADGAAAPAAKLPLIPLVAAMLVAVVLGAGGVGGGMLYMIKSGKIGGGVGSVQKVEAHEIAKTHGIVMEPILVNLTDAGGKSFLRVAMTIQVEDEPKVKGAKEEKPGPGPKVPTEAETAARDTVLTVLGQQSADSLLEPGGKEELKTKLKAELKTRNPDLKLTDLFFTEFLVQR